MDYDLFSAVVFFQIRCFYSVWLFKQIQFSLGMPKKIFGPVFVFLSSDLIFFVSLTVYVDYTFDY